MTTVDERLERKERVIGSLTRSLNTLQAELSKAEAERDDLRRRVEALDTALARISELEAALRFYGQASDAALVNDAGRIARRVLKGGE